MSLELNYKARNIAKAEQQFNLPMLTEVDKLMAGQVGVYQIAFFLVAGGYTEDEAYDIIDKQTVSVLQNEVIEELLTADFLVGGDEKAREAARAAVKQGQAELKRQTEALQGSGKTKKPTPTK